MGSGHYTNSHEEKGMEEKESAQQGVYSPFLFPVWTGVGWEGAGGGGGKGVGQTGGGTRTLHF